PATICHFRATYSVLSRRQSAGGTMRSARFHCTGALMSKPSAPTTGRTPNPIVALVGLTAGLGLILVVLLALFILPSLKSGPHDLPLGLVGTPEAIVEMEQNLERLMPGAFIAQTFASPDELREAIVAREVVGGYVTTDHGLQALVASAGSTAISGTVAATAMPLANAMSLAADITDIAPLPAADPSGIGIGGLTFPLVFGGI